MAAPGQGLVEIDQREYSRGELRDAGRFTFGPYRVTITRQRWTQPIMTFRRIPPEGRSTFRVETPTGTQATCVIEAADPWPQNVRASIGMDLDGERLHVTKRWFRPVVVEGSRFGWTLRRRGVFGWRLLRGADGHLIAERRWGIERVDGELSAEDAAATVALVVTGVPDAVSPLAFLRGL